MMDPLSTNRVVAAAQQLATAHHAPYDPSHDIHHVHRVVSLSLLISSTLEHHIDRLVVILAALFHDLLDKKYQTVAQTPEEKLAPFWNQFTQHQVSDPQRRLVERIIANVSYSKEVKRTATEPDQAWFDSCLELHCVQDADKLDAIGAFGIMRCSAYSAITNRPLFVPSSSSSSFPPAPKSSGSDAISHFHDKLVKLESMMKTNKGKQLARSRTARLTTFIDSIQDEWNEVEAGELVLQTKVES
ncbi:HD domain-containing protein [Sporobolomyces koalae]|uniref:HD domain-containing protein n=1 Tax=Sporobolomyces koalae TaxID=500713 RepID=UPI00317331BB